MADGGKSYRPRFLIFGGWSALRGAATLHRAPQAPGSERTARMVRRILTRRVREGTLHTTHTGSGYGLEPIEQLLLGFRAKPFRQSRVPLHNTRDSPELRLGCLQMGHEPPPERTAPPV